jgi:hypothetical protein
VYRWRSYTTRPATLCTCMFDVSRELLRAAKSCNSPGPARVSCMELDTLHATTVTCIPGLRYIAGDLRSGPANFRFPAVFPVTRMQGCSSSWVMPKSNANPHRQSQTLSQTLSHGQRTSTAQRSSTAAVRTSGHLHTTQRRGLSVHRQSTAAARCKALRYDVRLVTPVATESKVLTH